MLAVCSSSSYTFYSMNCYRNHRQQQQAGFTLLELLVVLVIIGLLLAIVGASYAGIQRNQHNQERERDIQDLSLELEYYYAANTKYPTLSELNTASWVAANLKDFDRQWLRDPSSKSYTLVATPKVNTYAYDVTAADGSTCDNINTICAHYTLTATLDGSAQKTYVKTSLN